MSKLDMDTANGDTDKNRSISDFKIPIKDQSKMEENGEDDNNIESFSSPIESEPLIETRFDKASLNNGQNEAGSMAGIEAISKMKQSSKRKLDSDIPIYTGRDPKFPEELNNLILPLCCNVCKNTLNSPRSAHFHYTSKSHAKKVNNWLQDWSTRTGEPIPKIQKDERTIDQDSAVLFCQICNVKLTSKQDAQQHYSGKKHASKLRMGLQPVPQGTLPKNTPVLVTKDGRFGIGEGFKPAEQVESPEEVVKNTYCEICNVRVTSEQQLILHQQGAKHLRKYKEINPTEAFADRDSKLPREILNCRTPSGQFYCRHCNVTVPDDKIFSQHLTSKRHSKNSKSDKEENKEQEKL